MTSLLRPWVTILFLLILSCSALASDKLPAKCLGGICIGSASRAHRLLIKEYGNGQKRSGDDAGSQVHCFYDPAQKLWIELEFSSKEHTKHNIQLTGIFVTAMPMCATSFKPKKPFSNLVSEYGVGLGDKESIVIEKMGSPTRRDDVVTLESKSPYLAKDNRYASKFGGTRLVYDDNPSSLLFNFYGFESGKVTSIWIADTE